MRTDLRDVGIVHHAGVHRHVEVTVIVTVQLSAAQHVQSVKVTRQLGHCQGRQLGAVALCDRVVSVVFFHRHGDA